MLLTLQTPDGDGLLGVHLPAHLPEPGGYPAPVSGEELWVWRGKAPSMTNVTNFFGAWREEPLSVSAPEVRFPALPALNHRRGFSWHHRPKWLRAGCLVAYQVGQPKRSSLLSWSLCNECLRAVCLLGDNAPHVTTCRHLSYHGKSRLCW